MAEYGAISQVINPGESVLFSLDIEPCRMGLIMHRQGTSNFLLSGWTMPRGMMTCGCLNRRPNAKYECVFNGNIAVADGGTPGAISLALTLDGATQPQTTMTVTPAAVEEYFNVSANTTLSIFGGCCETLTVRNISDQPIALSNGSITLTRPDLPRR